MFCVCHYRYHIGTIASVVGALRGRCEDPSFDLRRAVSAWSTPESHAGSEGTALNPLVCLLCVSNLLLLLLFLCRGSVFRNLGQATSFRVDGVTLTLPA